MLKSFITIALIILLNACAVKPVTLVPTPPRPPIVEPKKDIGIALVLGGGGAKGLAHAGVLEVLEKNNIPIDLIVGTSSGSIVGAMYADNPDYILLKAKLMSAKRSEILDYSYIDTLKIFTSLTGPVSGIGLEKFLINNIKTKNIEHLKIPLIIVTTDAINNQTYILDSGPIVPAVHASSALLPIFSPLKLYDKVLVDGGFTDPVPVKVAKKFSPKFTIAVNISVPPAKELESNLLFLTYHAIHILYHELSDIQSKLADVEILPTLTGYGMFDDSNREAIYKAGKQAAEAALPQIRQYMRKLNIKPKVRR
ncbi:Patatin-like phospholipase protein [Rickettsiales bacterium Ac37b]|nr:Patatin-like phospholipase protein [Rickettsiales bacterium Ac37b]